MCSDNEEKLDGTFSFIAGRQRKVDKDGARRLREAASKANYINALGILADPTNLLRHSIIKKMPILANHIVSGFTTD